MARALLLLALAGALACGNLTTPAPFLEGSWGGEHLGLVADDHGFQLEFDCATGRSLGSVALDGAGRFEVEGIYSPGHGGPIREGEIEPQHPARYAGVVRGQVMSVSVEVPALALTLGPFGLRRGAPAGVFKCL